MDTRKTKKLNTRVKYDEDSDTKIEKMEVVKTYHLPLQIKRYRKQSYGPGSVS